MRTPELEGLTPKQQLLPLWLLRVTTATILPAWLVLAAGGSIAALSWSLQGWAPAYRGLCLLLSLTYWLAGLALAQCWGKMQAGYQPAALQSPRRALMLLSLLGGAVLLAAAPLALGLAYDPDAVLHIARPVDVGELRFTLLPLLARLCLFAGPLYILASMSLLLLGQRLLGRSGGGLLWLGLGVLLHSPLWQDSAAGRVSLSFAAYSESVRRKLVDTELLQSDQIFTPLVVQLLLLWFAGVVLLLLASQCRGFGLMRFPALPAAAATGLLAVALESSWIAARWKLDALQHELRGLLDLPLHFALVTAICWLVLHFAAQTAAGRLRLPELLPLLPCAALLPLPAIPLLLQAPELRAYYLAATGLSLLCLLLVIAAARAAASLLHSSTQLAKPGNVAGLLTGLALCLLLFGPWPAADGESLQALTGLLTTSFFQPELASHALLASAALLVCTTLLVLLGRSPRIRRQKAQPPLQRPG